MTLPYRLLISQLSVPFYMLFVVLPCSLYYLAAPKHTNEAFLRKSLAVFVSAVFVSGSILGPIGLTFSPQYAFADDIFAEMNSFENILPNTVLPDHEFLKKKLHSSEANSDIADSLYNNNDNNENPLSESEKKTVHEFLLALHGDIDVLNEQSYPTVGGYWTVEFVTKGTHDLIVSAINATSFGAGLPDDVEFISLYDSDGSEIAPEFIYDDSGSKGEITSVVFPDYSNDDVGSFKMLVHTPGKHHLKFEFGNGVAYANNNAYPNSTIEINSSTTNGPDLSSHDSFGTSIANIGDLNGDGTSDIAVGATGDGHGGSNSGAVHILFMNDDGSVNQTIEINSSTANGPDLNILDFFGSSIANIGDLNGDGTSDIAVGAAGDDNGGDDSGAVHILFMNDDGSVNNTIEINSSTANGPDLSQTDIFGSSIANIGDLNGDGTSDIAVGATGDDHGGDDSGAVHILFMNDDGSVEQTVEINDSTANGPELSDDDFFGSSIANIGDLNGDGTSDIVVGATGDDDGGDNRGAIHILLMNDDGSVDQTVEINDSTANGPELSDGDFFGSSIANIGDLDNNGTSDIAVDAQGNDDGGDNRGAIHILFMNDDGSVEQTIEINDSTEPGPVLSDNDIFGSSIANIGDLDNNGTSDIAVGAIDDDHGGPSSGAIHIIYLSTAVSHSGAIEQTIEINSSTANGPDLSQNDIFGSSIANIGDLDNNGTSDIAVGAPSDDNGGNNKGAIHILLMNDDGSVNNTIEINDSTPNGPSLDAGDNFGTSIANIGDLNGDGTSDIAVGAPNDNDGGDDSGAVHILFINDDGSVNNTIEINDSTANGPDLNIADLFGSSIANIGDLNGDGTSDIAVGATGDDSGSFGSSGAVHILLMNDDGSVERTIEIDSTTANGPDLSSSDSFGSSIANIGDLNGDGTSDIAVGAIGDDDGGDDSGAVHILFINDDGSVEQTIEINSSTPNGPSLDAGDNFGTSIAGIADLDSDSVSHIAVGAKFGDDAGRGNMHILFINDDGSVSQTREINNSNTPSLDVTGPTLFGRSITTIGDLNGDGTSDIAVGEPNHFSPHNGGVIHIIYLDKSVVVNTVSSTTADGEYDTGALVDITIVFSEPVTVTGTPQITLETGDNDRTADYTSGSGTDTLTFQYIVQSGDVSPDLNYVDVNSLMLNGGSIISVDSQSNRAVLTLPPPDLVLTVTPSDAFGSLGNFKDLAIISGAPPTFESATLQEDIGLLSVTFSKALDQDSDTVAVDGFTITDDLPEGIEARLSVSLDGATHALDSGSPNTITITLTEGQRQQVVAYTSTNANSVLHLDIAAGAVQDTLQNDIESSEDNEITSVSDGVAPTFVSGVMDEGTGILSVTFSEAIDSDVTVDSFTISDTVTGNALPPVSLAGATPDIDSTSTDTLTITLTETQRQQVIAYTGTGDNLHLDIAEGAVRDTAQNDVAASENNNITSVSDSIAPTFDSAVVQEGTGVLSVTFSEVIDSDVTVDSFTISDTVTGNALPPVSLAGATHAIDSTPTDTITITLTETQRQQVIAYTGTVNNNDINLHLDIAEGAVQDTSENDIADSEDNSFRSVGDSIAPTFVSGMMEEGTGILSVTFSEAIDSDVTVDSFTISDTVTGNALPPVSLAGATHAVDSDTITITLTETQRQQVIAYNGTVNNNDINLHLDIAAGAVQDTSENDIADSEDNNITSVSDSIAPTFVSGVIEEGTGVLSVTFSETISSDSIIVGNFTISDTVGNSIPVSLAGATRIIDPDSDTIRITLTEVQRQQVIAYNGTVNNNDINLHLDIAEGAVRDTAQNDVAASEDNNITSVSDSIAPTFVSGVIQEGTGVLTVNFSETISPDSIIVGNFTISDTVGNSIPVSLAGTASAIDPISAHTITITLNEQQRQRVIGYTDTNLHLDIAEGAVQDTSENGIAASEDNPLEMVDDTIEPTFVSGVIHKVTGLLTVTFSETIDPDNITVDSFTISGTTGSSMSVSLAGAIHASPNSDTLEITVTEQQREEIISYIANSNSDDLHLDIAAGAIRDTAQNNIISSENNLITSTGTLPPPPTSSSGGSGRINVAVSEESHAEFLHKDINKSSCDSKGFGMGISLRIFSIGYDRETSTVNVELLSTCGPASVSVNTDAGVHLAALSLTSEQSPQSSANEAEKQHLVYSATINSDADSFAVTAKDKRDTFTQTITLSDDFVEKKYHHRTGYTSEQQSSLDILNAIEDDPRPIADKAVQKNTDPIPLWIKSDLKLWNGSPARDIFFFNSIDYLIDNHYIVYEDWEKSKSLQDIDTYPQWLLNDVGNYTDGNLTDMEFTELIETLIEERVIRIAK